MTVPTSFRMKKETARLPVCETRQKTVVKKKIFDHHMTGILKDINLATSK